jgi:hypothetical protein
MGVSKRLSQMPQIQRNCNIPVFVPNAANLFRDKPPRVSTFQNLQTMSSDRDIIHITGIAITAAACLFCFDESEDEDDMVIALLSDRKRRRRLFDTSRLYTEATVRGNLAQAIWSSSDERFAEQVRLSRLQFLHVRAAVQEQLTRPEHATGRPCALPAHDQLLLFLYHIAQCKWYFDYIDALCDLLAHLCIGTAATLHRYPIASTVSPVWGLACDRTAYSSAHVQCYH